MLHVFERPRVIFDQIIIIIGNRQEFICVQVLYFHINLKTNNTLFV